MANNLRKGRNWGCWKPLQQGSKKREKQGHRRVGDPPLFFGEFIPAHSHGCFVCYGRSSPFEQDHRTCPSNQSNAAAYKKAHGTKNCTSANIREVKVEVSKVVGTELAQEIQEIKRAWRPKPDKDKNKDKDKDKKGKGRWTKERDAVNRVAAGEDTQTTDAP